MKFALSLLLMLGAFGLGWMLNDHETPPLLSNGDGKGILVEKAEARWRSKTNRMTDREIAEAIYRGELDGSLDERLSQLVNISQKLNQFKMQIDLRYLVLSMSEEEILTSLDKLENNVKNQAAIHTLLARWVELDLEGAYARYLQDPEDKLNQYLLHHIVINWARDDLQGALNLIQQMPVDRQKQCLNMLIHDTMGRNPTLALELQLSYGTTYDYTYQSIFQKLTLEDPEAAWAAIGNLPPQAYRHAIQGYFNTLKDTDFNLAFARSAEITNLDLQRQIQSTLYTEWFRNDPEAALSALTNERNPEYLIQIWNLKGEQAQIILDWALANLDGRQQDNFVNRTLSAMIQRDRETAAAYIEKLPYGNNYRNAMNQLLAAQFLDDRDGTLAWLESLPNSQEKRDYTRTLMDKYMQEDYEAAKAYFLTLDPDSQKQAAYCFANAMSEVGAENILAWAQAQSSDQSPDSLQNTILQNWAGQDPWACMDYIGPTGFAELENGAQRNIMSAYARKDPASAAAWLDQVSEESLPSMTDVVTKAWLDHDPYEASIWIAELPTGDSRDRAVVNLVQEVRRSDPASAFDWATGIDDNEKRQQQTSRVIRDWPDPYAAEEAILASDLSEEEIKKLQSSLKFE
ncbi:hypothetical protein [Cerasicoccus frondis]|uniref:hypothetical protein n=1 Tax=Cerasicoccus frondis TaxID=490090 RepID=UPI002852D04C|nr:hypothetical protein [Cerasicoccus frondis]